MHHGGGKAAALDHKAVNHAVKNRAFVVLVCHVAQEVFYGFGRFVGLQFDHKVALAGLELYAAGRLRLRRQSNAGHQGQYGNSAPCQGMGCDRHQITPSKNICQSLAERTQYWRLWTPVRRPSTTSPKVVTMVSAESLHCR